MGGWGGRGVGRRRDAQWLVLIPRGLWGPQGARGWARLLQPLSPVQVVVAVRGVVWLGGDAVQGPFQSCRGKGGHSRRAHPTRLRTQSPSEQRAQLGLQIKGALRAGGFTAPNLF